MTRIESVEDEIKGVVTYELTGGLRVCLDKHAAEKYGPADLIRSMGHGDKLPTGRLPVMQRGKRVGFVPADFDPMFIKSDSFFYQPRHGDFTRDENGWVAAPMLGPGDLEAVRGFNRFA
jgi:hypothetical protein